jgi:hypothetical protein
MFDLMIRNLQLQRKTNNEIIEILQDCCFEAVSMTREALLQEINNAGVRICADGTLSF